VLSCVFSFGAQAGMALAAAQSEDDLFVGWTSENLTAAAVLAIVRELIRHERDRHATNTRRSRSSKLKPLSSMAAAAAKPPPHDSMSSINRWIGNDEDSTETLPARWDNARYVWQRLFLADARTRGRVASETQLLERAGLGKQLLEWDENDMDGSPNEDDIDDGDRKEEFDLKMPDGSGDGSLLTLKALCRTLLEALQDPAAYGWDEPRDFSKETEAAGGAGGAVVRTYYHRETVRVERPQLRFEDAWLYRLPQPADEKASTAPVPTAPATSSSSSSASSSAATVSGPTMTTSSSVEAAAMPLPLTLVVIEPTKTAEAEQPALPLAPQSAADDGEAKAGDEDADDGSFASYHIAGHSALNERLRAQLQEAAEQERRAQDLLRQTQEREAAQRREMEAKLVALTNTVVPAPQVRAPPACLPPPASTDLCSSPFVWRHDSLRFQRR
jgi:hypothetical protein